MNFAYQRSVGPLFIAAVLVIVNGKSTPDDKNGRAEISELRDRIVMLERQLHSIGQSTEAGKLGTLRFEQHALLLLRTFLAYLRFVFKLRLWLSHNHFSLIITIHQTRIFTARRYAQARSLLSSCVSVLPSVTLVVVKLLVRPGSPITLFFYPKRQCLIQRGTPSAGRSSTRGWKFFFAIFDWNRRLSRKRYEIGLWLLWNVSRKS